MSDGSEGRLGAGRGARVQCPCSLSRAETFSLCLGFAALRIKEDSIEGDSIEGSIDSVFPVIFSLPLHPLPRPAPTRPWPPRTLARRLAQKRRARAGSAKTARALVV